MESILYPGLFIWQASKYDESQMISFLKLIRISLILLMLMHSADSFTQEVIQLQSAGFSGKLHDNIANEKRQGSGFNPLILNDFPGKNIFRNDAVGLNFEHIFNGGRAQHSISMFTPRQDPCHLRNIGENQYEIFWPGKNSQWSLEARMAYDLSTNGQIDMEFECTPGEVKNYSQGYVAMMWASYMNRAIDRNIHFWGREGGRVGWVQFGTDENGHMEVGTVAHVDATPLDFEEGAQTLNLTVHPEKKFIAPFYYGLLDGDQDLGTTDDKLLYLVMFDQSEPIRFAMWNFIKNKQGEPDTHSPAWDWQYVIKNPALNQTYKYRARIVIKPYLNKEQVWTEYRNWINKLQISPSFRIP